MLNEHVRWAISVLKRLRQDYPDTAAVISNFDNRLVALENMHEEPLELLIFCPVCKTQHIDVGEFGTTPHKRHACQSCGLLFSVTKEVPNIGVRFFKDCRDGVRIGGPAGSGMPGSTISPGCIPPGHEVVARVGDYVTVYKGQSW